MDNASKALILAGGLIVAMITISVFYYIFGNLNDYQRVTSIDYDVREQTAYNKRFEAYNKELMYGSDIVSVYNLIQESYEKYKDYTGYVKPTLNYPGGDDIAYIASEMKRVGADKIVTEGATRDDSVTKFIMSLYKCTGITYNEERMGEQYIF